MLNAVLPAQTEPTWVKLLSALHSLQRRLCLSGWPGSSQNCAGCMARATAFCVTYCAWCQGLVDRLLKQVTWQGVLWASPLNTVQTKPLTRCILVWDYVTGHDKPCRILSLVVHGRSVAPSSTRHKAWESLSWP